MSHSICRFRRPRFTALLTCAVVCGCVNKAGTTPSESKVVLGPGLVGDSIDFGRYKEAPFGNQAPGRAPAQAATSSFTLAPDSGGVQRYRSVNRRFLFTETSAPDSGILIRETVVEDCCRQAESRSEKTIELSGWTAGDRTGAPRWTTKLLAEDGALWRAPRDAFYVGRFHGCCAALDLDMYVSARTGRVAFVNSVPYSTTNERALPVASADRWAARYVAFHDTYAELPPAEALGHEDVVGVLQYGGADGPTQRAVVRRAVPPKPNDMPPRINRLTLGTAASDTAVVLQIDRRAGAKAEDTFTGFSVVLRLDLLEMTGVANATIRVPVVNDRLDVAHAEVPKGFTIQPLPPT